MNKAARCNREGSLYSAWAKDRKKERKRAAFVSTAVVY
jgi:hypothetical protein